MIARMARGLPVEHEPDRILTRALDEARIRRNAG
jgi:hypothetical protein